MFNRSIKHSVIPGIWKCSRVIPLLKPGKPADQAKSYKPVSLLSPLIKLLETSMLPFVLESFSHAEHQHGFRKGHSTTTAHHCSLRDRWSHKNRPQQMKTRPQKYPPTFDENPPTLDENPPTFAPLSTRLILTNSSKGLKIWICMWTSRDGSRTTSKECKQKSSSGTACQKEGQSAAACLKEVFYLIAYSTSTWQLLQPLQKTWSW